MTKPTNYKGNSMTPTNDQYDPTVEKIDAASTLADTGLDILPMFLLGFGLVLLGFALWFAMRRLAR